MKFIKFLLIVALAGCNTNNKEETKVNNDLSKANDTIGTKEPHEKQVPEKQPTSSAKIYSNERFKEVTVEKIGEHTFQIKGKGQIFEASFSWVVEDGHQELKKGFQMTDAGAPEWGNFSFIIDVEKKRSNSTLNLILFESSPKDGSRQYELPVLLY
ncbi:MAG: Gmad2 immunoglobulin-like domain-containing protein [Ginsengibacter sp.]